MWWTPLFEGKRWNIKKFENISETVGWTTPTGLLNSTNKWTGTGLAECIMKEGTEQAWKSIHSQSILWRQHKIMNGYKTIQQVMICHKSCIMRNWCWNKVKQICLYNYKVLKSCITDATFHTGSKNKERFIILSNSFSPLF